MADKAAVKDGEKIQYAREDAGGAIGWGKGNAKRGSRHQGVPVTRLGWRLTPGEMITAGKDIPLDVCARLVEDGICALVATSMAAATAPQIQAPAATMAAAGSTITSAAPTTGTTTALSSTPATAGASSIAATGSPATTPSSVSTTNTSS